MLVLTPGTILDQSHLCAHVFWGENPTLMHGDFLAPGRLLESKYDFFKKFSLLKNSKKFFFLYPQTSLILSSFERFFVEACLEHPGPGFVFGEKESKSSKKSEFSKKGPLLKNSKTFFFLVSLGCPETFLFNKLFDWSMFRASWAWLCVWGKFCKFLKNQNQIFWEDPLCKKSKTFFILVSLEYPDTFLFNKIFGGSKFWGVWIWICVCRSSSKNRQKSVKKMILLIWHKKVEM